MGSIKMKRIAWIDAAKGIGIFLVVLGHTLPSAAKSVAIIYAFHMPLFFFLSGLTAKSWAPGSASAFVRGFRSLIVPYVFFSVISIAVFVVSHGLALQVEAWGAQLWDMVYGVAGAEGRMRYNVPLWYFTCFICVRVLFATLSAKVPNKVAQIALVVAVAAFTHAYVLPNYASMIWNFDVALIALAFFTAGYIAQGVNISPMAWPVAWRGIAALLVLLMFAAAVVLNGRVDMNGRAFGTPVWYYVGAFAGIALSAVLANCIANVSFVKILGRASIVIFPVHAFFGCSRTRFFRSSTGTPLS
jgi:acyltransferase